MAASSQADTEREVRESTTRIGGARWLTFQDSENDSAYLMARIGSKAHAPFTDPDEGHVIRYDRHDSDGEVYR